MQKLNLLALLVSFLGTAFNLFAQNSLDKDIEPIVADLVKKMNTKVAIKNVAVADFIKLDGTSTELGKYLAEQFADALTNSNTNFGVVDRSRVNSLLKEAGLETKGLMDPNTVAKLGKLKGFNAIVTGTITPMSDVIALNVKVLDLETAVTLASRKGNINRTPAVMELEGKELGGENNSGGATTPMTKTTVPTTPVKPKPSAVSTFKKDPIFFECLGCTQSGETVDCQLRITSQGQDIDIQVWTGYGPCRIIDDEGNDFELSDWILANTKQKKTLVTDLPINARFSFNKVNRPVQTVSKMEITFGATNLGYITIPFRNIPVTRK